VPTNTTTTTTKAPVTTATPTAQTTVAPPSTTIRASVTTAAPTVQQPVGTTTVPTTTSTSVLHKIFRQHLSGFETRIANLLADKEALKVIMDNFEPTFDNEFFVTGFEEKNW